jgi:hypothetical protein
MWLLLLMILVMPYEANPYLYLADDLLGVFPDFTLIKLLGLMGFAWAGLNVLTGNVPGGLFVSRTARLFLLFFAGVVFMGLFSGTGFVAVSRFLAFLLFMPFVLVSARSQREVRLVVYTLALSLILVFPYALRQMIRFESRLGVGLYETNYFAAILVLVIPLACVIALQQRVGLGRWGWMLGAVTLLGMLYLTSSRGGFIGLLAAAMVFVYHRRGALGALGVMTALVAAVFVLPTDLGTRALATVFQDPADLPPGLEMSNRAHTALFWAALRMIGENPMFGVGPARFKELSTLYTDADVPAHIAHNTFLEVGAEFGLPVLAVFVLLVVSVLATLTRAMRVRGSREARELAGWAEGLRAGLIGFLVAGLFISAQYEKLFWLTVFISIPIGALARRHEAAAWAAEPEPAPPPALAPAAKMA